MKTFCLGLAITLCCLGVLQAHHAVTSIYDSKKPVEVKGTISKFDWINPHAMLYLEVKDESGGTTRWAFEMGSPNILVYNGLPKDFFKTGDTITAKGDRARDGSTSARAHTLTTADGKRVFSVENIVAPSK